MYVTIKVITPQCSAKTLYQLHQVPFFHQAPLLNQNPQRLWQTPPSSITPLGAIKTPFLAWCHWTPLMVARFKKLNNLCYFKAFRKNAFRQRVIMLHWNSRVNLRGYGPSNYSSSGCAKATTIRAARTRARTAEARAATARADRVLCALALAALILVALVMAARHILLRPWLLCSGSIGPGCSAQAALALAALLMQHWPWLLCSGSIGSLSARTFLFSIERRGFYYCLTVKFFFLL